MKRVLSLSALAVIISLSAGDAQACSETRIGACPPTPAPMVQFKGDKKIEQPIQVWVCHPYWELLDGREGPAGDPQSRWWGPCLGGREITTGPMSMVGAIYLMDLPK